MEYPTPQNYKVVLS